MNQKTSGLHPNAQMLLRAIAYDLSFQYEMRTLQQLERSYLVEKSEVTGRWEITPQGRAALDFYAPFLKRRGLDCPPKS